MLPITLLCSSAHLLDDLNLKCIVKKAAGGRWHSIRNQFPAFVQIEPMSSNDQSVTIEHQLDTVLVNIADLRCSITDLFCEHGCGASIRSKTQAIEAQLAYYRTLLDQRLFIIQNLELSLKAALAMIATAQHL